MKAAQVPAAAVVPGLIIARHRSAVTAARRAARTQDPADFHRLRIRCKRLRYALEFVSEIYDGRTRGVVRRVVRLQDCLGLMQDAEVAASRLHSLATTENAGLSPATVFAMGGVADRYRREADRLSGTVPAYLEALKGPQWKKLKALMERRRTEIGPPDTWSPDPPEPNGSTADDDGSDHAPGNKASATWPTGSSRPRPSQDTTDDDPEWDDAYAPALRSVPVEQQDVDEPRPVDDPTPSDVPRSPVPAPAEPSVGRRRKEPVFLPAPPSAPRPAQGRPVPRAEPPPDDGRTRSFHHRP
jgi:hypothetical protein